MTTRPARRASWIAIEPTPPAPPMISSDLPASRPSASRRMRSNISSQAVMLVSGSAAASAKSSDAGLRPTMRSSTSWYWALLPLRVMSPA